MGSLSRRHSLTHSFALSLSRSLSIRKDVTSSGNTEMQLSPYYLPSIFILSAPALEDLGEKLAKARKSEPDVTGGFWAKSGGGI